MGGVELETVAFVVSLSTGIVLLAGYLASFAWPQYRFWPPGDRNWKYWLHWTLDPLHHLSLLALGVLAWGSFGFPRPASLVVGSAVFVIGAAIAVAAEYDVGHEESAGIEGALRTGGLYHYSRNPQYVGLILATVGFVLLTDATPVVFVGGLRVLTWLVVPLPEETWLRQAHGDEYERYRSDVPRFVGVRTVQRLLDR